MSRSGYSDGLDQWDLIRWRGAVTSAIRGARGQAFLHEMLDALDAMPQKRLVTGALKVEMGDSFEDEWGEPWGPKTEDHCGVCALGSVGLARAIPGADLKAIRPDDSKALSETFGIAEAMAREIMYVNDDHRQPETPEKRWQRVRNWVESQILPAPPGGAE